MDPKFRAFADALHPKFEELMRMAPVSGILPREVKGSGIYLFSEAGKHLLSAARAMSASATASTRGHRRSTTALHSPSSSPARQPVAWRPTTAPEAMAA